MDTYRNVHEVRERGGGETVFERKDNRNRKTSYYTKIVPCFQQVGQDQKTDPTTGREDLEEEQIDKKGERVLQC